MRVAIQNQTYEPLSSPLPPIKNKMELTLRERRSHFQMQFLKEPSLSMTRLIQHDE